MLPHPEHSSETSSSLTTSGPKPALQAPKRTTSATVVVPCRNEVGHIETCLRSVLAFEEPPGGFEVIVADGMSDDGTREVVSRVSAEDSRVRLIDNPQQTTSAGLNAAIREADSEVIVRVDAHTEYAPDYLVECLKVLRETGADNVGGPALTKATSYVQRAIAAAFHSRFAIGDAVFHQPGYEGPADTVPYGCYYRSQLLELGLFDDSLVRNQDDELNLRLLHAGGRIWQSPRIRSWYKPRSSLSALFRQYWQYGYWKIRVMQKHHGPPSLRHVIPGTGLLVMLVLGLLAAFVPVALQGLLLLLAGYLLALLAACLLIAWHAGWSLLPVLPLVILCYHVSYGLGNMAGVWDFLVLRRAKGRFIGLSR